MIKNQNSELSVVNRLLNNRNIEGEEALNHFLNADLSHLHDPFLMKGMKEGVDRIRVAVENNENILVFGDYDVDGITSTVLVYEFLKNIGANVSYQIPHREKDGYGLKDYFIRDFF